MLSIGVELLTGVYAASAYDDRDTAEWPPHPGRFFSALTASWAAGGQSAEERRALEWLEQQTPPGIVCSSEELVGRRSVATHFVPVNDPSGLAFLPSERGLQPRTYPAAVPSSPTFSFVWADAEPAPEIEQALSELLQRVWRLGHSSTLVSCVLEERTADPAYTPDPNGAHRLRVPTEGLLEALEDAYASHRGTEPRVLPNWTVRYQPAVSVRATGLYDDLVCLRLQGRSRLPVETALGWCRALRGALNRHAVSANDFVAGHEPGSSDPRTSPHPCFVPLVHCDSEHADGLIHGFGIVLPRDTSTAQRLAIEEALDAWSASENKMELYTRGGRSVKLERVPSDDRRLVLRAERWSSPARRWASVTPVVLDRFPDDLSSSKPEKRQRGLDEARAIIVAAVTSQGLPDPDSISVSVDAPVMVGSASARSFERYRRGRGGPALVKVHCRLQFREPVEGPLVIGAGRHLGFGIMAARRDA